MRLILLFLLFRITGNGVHEPSYLLATNRYVDCAFADSIPGCLEAYASCSQVVTEFVLDSATLAEQTHHSELTMRPGYLYSVVRDSIINRSLGSVSGRPLDTFFAHVASQTGIPVVGLDDMGETLYMLLERTPEEHRSKMLQQLMEFPLPDIDLETDILRLYRQGALLDIAYRISAPDNQATIGYADYAVWAKRNKVWAKRLTPMLRQGGYFITLDACYLGGDQGLIAELQSAGFRVKPIKR